VRLEDGGVEQMAKALHALEQELAHVKQLLEVKELALAAQALMLELVVVLELAALDLDVLASVQVLMLAAQALMLEMMAQIWCWNW
jgi:hypothetical protein